MRALELILADLAPAPSTGINVISNDTTSSWWVPFPNAFTCVAYMALALVIVLVTVRFLLCRRCSTTNPQVAREGPPPTVYKSGETDLAGTAADCAICLSEFADGDVLRVLPLCRHGFHSECVGAWLAFSIRVEPSCPVCRASFHPWKNSPDLEP